MEQQVCFRTGDRVQLCEPYLGLSANTYGVIRRHYQTLPDFYQVYFQTRGLAIPVPNSVLVLADRRRLDTDHS